MQCLAIIAPVSGAVCVGVIMDAGVTVTLGTALTLAGIGWGLIVCYAFATIMQDLLNEVLDGNKNTEASGETE
jgi:hypothetical protein